MPEALGPLILSAAGATDVVGIAGLGTLATTTVAGVSLASIVGSAAIIGTSIGLQYALSKAPGLPKPEDGSEALRQSIPPRQRGYGINRLAGYYLLFEAVGSAPATSYDVIAFHSGPVERLLDIYLNNDRVNTTPDARNGGSDCVVADFGDGSYAGDRAFISVRLGTDDQPRIAFNDDPNISPIWDSSHIGKGIAMLGLALGGLGDPELQSRTFPQGRPSASVVAVCSPIWDPRDGSQSFDDPSTWRVRYNPVLQLIDYFTRVDGGMGQDIDIAIPPAVLQQLMIEADLCDQLVEVDGGGAEPRYSSHGWFRYNDNPEDVINALLSACDGWLAEAGDGTLALTVGVYREPIDPPLTEDNIVGWSFSNGQADEQLINVLNVSFTDPSQDYVEAPRDDVRDEDSIDEIGAEKPKALSLTWVQSGTQADRLAERAISRLNPKRSGALITGLYGLRYLGKRWIKVQYPQIADLADCVIEIQPSPQIDLMAGQVRFPFNLVDVEKLETDSVANPPPYPREDGLPYVREDGSLYFREAA